jgi:L-malate glycosyltransferase
MSENKKLKILIVTPTYLPNLTGNAIDVERISKGLIKKDHDVKILLSNNIIEEEILDFKPDLVHAFHGYKSNNAINISKKLNLPVILTLTGTDYNDSLKDDNKKEVVISSLKNSDIITVLSNSGKEKIKDYIIDSKINIIPRGYPNIPVCDNDLREKHNYSKDDIIFCLLGSIRNVKNPLFAIPLMEDIIKVFPKVRFIIAGEIFDKDLYSKMESLINNNPRINFIGPIERDKISCVFDAVDCFINTSLSEGSSNVIYEAMIYSKPVIASDIDGNKEIITHGNTGLLFKDETDFTEAVRLFIEHPGIRMMLGINASSFIELKINKNEIEDYERLYNSLI